MENTLIRPVMAGPVRTVIPVNRYLSPPKELA
jgi:hypothetical protein